jgi:hypothetical protein
MGSCYVEFVGILGAFIHFYAVLSGLCLLRTIQFLSGTLSKPRTIHSKRHAVGHCVRRVPNVAGEG